MSDREHMSVRDEMMRAISSHPLDDAAATDAALAVVRSHRDRLADELDKEACSALNYADEIKSDYLRMEALATQRAVTRFRRFLEEPK